LNELCNLWDTTTEQQRNFQLWERNFQLLRKFYEREGHCNVPQSHVEDEIKLGRWLSDQRRFKKSKRLDSKRVNRLNELCNLWDASTENFQQWERNFQLLHTFCKREGHCNVSTYHVEDGIKLGYWLRDQRQLKKIDRLDNKRVTRLNELGICWDAAKDNGRETFDSYAYFIKWKGIAMFQPLMSNMELNWVLGYILKEN